MLTIIKIPLKNYNISSLTPVGISFKNYKLALEKKPMQSPNKIFHLNDKILIERFKFIIGLYENSKKLYNSSMGYTKLSIPMDLLTRYLYRRILSQIMISDFNEIQLETLEKNMGND